MYKLIWRIDRFHGNNKIIEDAYLHVGMVEWLKMTRKYIF